MSDVNSNSTTKPIATDLQNLNFKELVESLNKYLRIRNRHETF
jgi:hypothetical protein